MKILILLFILSICCVYQGFAQQDTIKKFDIEVSYNKTLHIIFPAVVTYVDLGSENVIAAKAPGAENILRVKAVKKDFPDTTNFTVITGDGNFYSFVVRYSDKPAQLNILIRDNHVIVEDLNDVPPVMVDNIARTIYKSNRNDIKYLGCKRYSVQILVKSIHVYKGLFFIHVIIKNNSNIPFDIDYTRFTIRGRKLIKRTARQEIQVNIVKAFNAQTTIGEHSTIRTVYVLPKFTISSDKIFVIDLIEKEVIRNLTIQIESEDFFNAKTIENLKL